MVVEVSTAVGVVDAGRAGADENTFVDGGGNVAEGFVVLVAEVLLLRGSLWSLLVAEALLLLVEVLLLVSVFVWC
jgi:hypothetical protein